MCVRARNCRRLDGRGEIELVTVLCAQDSALCPALSQLRQRCTHRANFRLQLAGLCREHRDRREAIPEGLPLNLHDEAHFPADRSSVTYRKGLAALGLGRGFTA
jgi:hypothetical protein